LAIKARETAAAAREAAIWNKETDLAVVPLVRTAARKGLSALLTGLKKDIPAEDRAEFQENLVNNFFKRVGEDGDFTRKLNDLRKANDRDGIVTLVKSVREKHMRDALKDLYRSKLLDRNALRDEASGKGEANSGSTSNSTKLTTLNYTGQKRFGAPPVEIMDGARIKEYDAKNGTHLLEDRMFFMKNKKELYRW